MKNILCCSGGNDSVALIQWAKENNLSDVAVLYNNTGWASSGWPLRMKEVKILCDSYGFGYYETQSEGFEAMVLRKKGFPQCQRMQFCTGELKMKPTLTWLQEVDPDKTSVIYIGIRREESVKRSTQPYEILFDARYEGRLQRFPLYKHTEKQRDFLVDEAGLDILLHSSQECTPCVCSNRAELRALANDIEKIKKIEAIEKKLGFTSKGKPCVMYRPYRHMGATGIREVIEWAKADRGKYKKEEK